MQHLFDGLSTSQARDLYCTLLGDVFLGNEADTLHKVFSETRPPSSTTADRQTPGVETFAMEIFAARGKGHIYSTSSAGFMTRVYHPGH